MITHMTETTQQTAQRQVIQQARWDTSQDLKQVRSELETVLVYVGFKFGLTHDQLLAIRCLVWDVRADRNPGLVHLQPSSNCPEPIEKKEAFSELKQLAINGRTGTAFRHGECMLWVDRYCPQSIGNQLRAILGNLEEVFQPISGDI